MKILLLTQYFPPEFGAAAARNSEHALYWAQSGHEVEVLTGFPNYPEGVIPPGYSGRYFVREECGGYTLARTWIYATPNRGILQRALASFSFLLSATIAGVLRCGRPDVIIASSGPFFMGPLGWLLSRLKGVPFALEVRDILPQQAVDTGMLRNPVLIQILEAIEAFLYRHARRVICVAEASRQSIIERGFDADKFFTIENGIREDLFVPGEKENAFRQEFGWEGRFVALYAGAHGVSQGLATLLDVAERLKDDPRFQLVFAGEGAEKPALIAEAESRGLRNVTFLPPQGKSRMPALYAAADVCFAPLRRGAYFTLNIPSKIFEIMACARPIILGADGQARRLVEEAQAGIAVAPEDADAFVRAVHELRDAPERAKVMGESGRRYVIEHFTRQGQAARYIEILEAMQQSEAPRN